MKKRILLFSGVAAMLLMVLTSGQTGAGHESGYNATGSETGLGNVTGCSASGCHGASPTLGITVKLELDSNGAAQTYYTPGATYTVKITGTNTTTNTLSHFGFQISCITGISPAMTPTNAGTFASTSLPTDVQYTAAIATRFVCNMMEHDTPIPATTGSGGTGSTYVESVQWTAPAAGTGNISFWGALNAVNFDHFVTGDFWDTTKLIIHEGRKSLYVNSVSSEFSINAFPNPTTSNLNLQLNNAEPGQYTMQVVGISGRTFLNENIVVNSVSQNTVINTANWAPGLYNVVIEKDGNRKSTLVVKQ